MYVFTPIPRARSPIVAMPQAIVGHGVVRSRRPSSSPSSLLACPDPSLFLPGSTIRRPGSPQLAWRPGTIPARAGLAKNGGWIQPGAPMPGVRRPGLGQVSTQSVAQIAASGATTTISTLVALGTITGPVGAAIAGVVAIATELVGIFKGCGQTCVEASDIANQVGAALTTNLQTYLAAPIHYASLQAAALNNFNTAWQAMVQGCGNPQLASAGQNCISERQQGACSYHTTPGGWQQGASGWTYVYPGANGSGSTCWNYWVGFHDPIANDPTVVPDPPLQGATSFVSQGLTDIGINASSTLFGIPVTYLALGAAGLVLLSFLD